MVVVVIMVSWCAGVLRGRPRAWLDRSRIYTFTRASALYLEDALEMYVLSVRLSTPGRRPKNSGFDVAEGRF
jgi:hypothetical protein